MCFLIAKRFDKQGCIAMQTQRGQKLVDFKKKLMQQIGYDIVQLVTISRPSAYGEYEPYHFVKTEEEFESLVKKM